MMRTRVKLNENWHFHEGDITPVPLTDKNSAYQHAKTRRALQGPASVNYNSNPDNWDTRAAHPSEPWQAVTLPHDYIITQTPDRQYNNTLGYFRYGNAWYRKHFRLEAEDADKRITLLFESVSSEATVWVNGCKMAHHHTGYSPFLIDITEIANFGGDNVIAVYVQSEDHEGWWYEGAGIVRHVWLQKTAMVSVDDYGVFVHPELTEGTTWNCPVDLTLRCDRFADTAVCVTATVLDENGTPLASASGTAEIPCKNKTQLSLHMTVENPLLWDTDAPHMHLLRTEVFAEDGTPLDCVETPFGFRTIRFDADKGFFLNGRSVKINGVCCHQDYGLTGRAIPESRFPRE
ncbi:MAG: beta galactosidase jelly roll domain-containing protein [Clostridia bacterium]|nr:beta galactosidase jelly roll domain-containing protein [Clostridia bacterium]